MAHGKLSALRHAELRQRLIAQFGDIPTAKRFLLRKTGGRCWLCHHHISPQSTVTFDHIYPGAYGGTNDWDNLMPAHSHCNGYRGDKPQR